METSLVFFRFVIEKVRQLEYQASCDDCPGGKVEVCAGEVVTFLQIAPQVIGPTMPSTCNALSR